MTGPVTLLIATLCSLWFCYNTDYEKDLLATHGMGGDELALLRGLDAADDKEKEAVANLKTKAEKQIKRDLQHEMELDMIRKEIKEELQKEFDEKLQQRAEEIMDLNAASQGDVQLAIRELSVEGALEKAQ